MAVPSTAVLLPVCASTIIVLSVAKLSAGVPTAALLTVDTVDGPSLYGLTNSSNKPSLSSV